MLKFSLPYNILQSTTHFSERVGQDEMFTKFVYFTEVELRETEKCTDRPCLPAAPESDPYQSKKHPHHQTQEVYLDTPLVSREFSRSSNRKDSLEVERMQPHSSQFFHCRWGLES